MIGGRHSAEQFWNSRKKTIASGGMILLLAAWTLTSVNVEAQESGTERFHGTAGPYEIGVNVESIAPFSGDLHYSITVLNALAQDPVPGARVRILANNRTDETEGWAMALNSLQTPERFQANMELEAPGIWDISVEVTGNLGTVSVELEPEVVRESIRSTESSLFYFGLLAILALGGLYVWWNMRRVQRNRNRLTATPAANNPEVPR